MRPLRLFTIPLLVGSLSMPAFAGDLRESAARAAKKEASTTQSQGGSKALMWTGASLFVGGMAVGLYGFLNNKNGEFPEFGEAEATNKPLGTAGLVTAFVGGTLMFLGTPRSSRVPTVTVEPARVTLRKQVTW